MARRRRAEKRVVPADAKYGSELVAHMINKVMNRGKKAVAERLVYGAIDQIQTMAAEEDPLDVFEKGINNVKPQLEVKSRRVGGATYQVPIEVSGERQTTLALRWLIGYARARKGMAFSKALAMELMDASRNTGSAIKKRDDTHKMAQANKAFAHYRW